MVIDTSVYVASLRVQEPGHAVSLAFLGAAASAGDVLHAPTIMIAEVAAAIARGTANPAVARQVVSALAAARHVRLLPVTHALATRAAEMAADLGLRGCDAVFVALAEHLGVALVTLDEAQRERGAAVIATRRP